MTRFHVRPEAVEADRVLFDEQETRHLSRVLRLRPGDSVQVVDGRGTEFTVRLESIEGRTAAGTILTRSSSVTESPLAVTLAQGIPKGDKMEWIVRTVTELGVVRVLPLVTERTIVRLEPGRWRDRARRWQRVAKEAAKQCGRAVIPTVEAPRPLQEFAGAAPAADLRLCLWEGERRGLSEILDDAARGPVASVLLAVGPEGGLAAREVETLVAQGFTSAGLGPRILRTETAGPVGVALLQGRFGDVGAPRP
ncbi:MAG: 16S rRNA (uracil(1498)-N(3))-methyltransferase [Candidatus Rokubacteria bacterium]|nr:16S rRNA (uracil(1498)-N(3))-methyltransferase [Candidatus Rokubacteria bacterium]